MSVINVIMDKSEHRAERGKISMKNTMEHKNM